MRAGKLRHLVSLEKYEETFDSAGQPVMVYTELYKAWAEIRPLLGYEAFNEKQVNTEQTHRIQVRYRPGMEQTMRFKWDDRYFELVGVPSNWMERDIFLFFKVKEVFTHVAAHPETI